MTRTNSRPDFERLLGEMIEHPGRQAEIIQTVDDLFGQDKAVMVVDMSGFCRATRDHSIVLVLSMVHQMQLLLKPCVEARGGVLVKAEADNLFCLFDTVFQALQACPPIHSALHTANLRVPEHCHLNVSIGIGYGHILNIEDKDLFGDEVNLASKLGEDIANRGEVLLTESAFSQLQEAGPHIEAEAVEVSGFALRYHVVHQHPAS